MSVSPRLCDICLKWLFCSVFLSICLFAQFVWVVCGVCVLCVCVCVCLSLPFLIRSQQSVARWELSLSTFLLIHPPYPPISLPTCEAQNAPLINLSKWILSPSIPRCLGYDHNLPPCLLFPFIKVISCLNIGTLRQKDNIGNSIL